MQEAITAVLLDRAREPDGLRRMVWVSIAAHVAVLVVIALGPRGWPASRSEDPESVMTISLGGAPGPRSGGMTPMGGRPIQSTAPLPRAPRPEPIRPPAAKPPEMTVPAQRAPARPRAEPEVKTAPPEGRGRTPTRGAEEQAGSAVADTGGRGVGFGLTTGGGGTGGYLDVGDFCCPEYLSTMVDRIRRNWDPRQPVTGEVLMKFTIQRDGRITDVALERSSGYVALDLAAQRALALTGELPPLPSGFSEERLTVHLFFQYQR